MAGDLSGPKARILLMVALGSRALRGFLSGLGPLDPVTFAAASGLLAAIVLTASYVPARRASRVDPVASLRIE